MSHTFLLFLLQQDLRTPVLHAKRRLRLPRFFPRKLSTEKRTLSALPVMESSYKCLYTLLRFVTLMFIVPVTHTHTHTHIADVSWYLGDVCHSKSHHWTWNVFEPVMLVDVPSHLTHPNSLVECDFHSKCHLSAAIMEIIAEALVLPFHLTRWGVPKSSLKRACEGLPWCGTLQLPPLTVNGSFSQTHYHNISIFFNFASGVANHFYYITIYFSNKSISSNLGQGLQRWEVNYKTNKNWKKEYILLNKFYFELHAMKFQIYKPVVQFVLFDHKTIIVMSYLFAECV